MREPYTIAENETKYVRDFVFYYNRLPKREQKKIDAMRPKYTLHRCWYYCKVWYYTLQNINYEQSKKRNSTYCIDHIVPISKGFINSIEPVLIGSAENIQFVTHKENLHKSTKLTDRGVELLKIFYDKNNLLQLTS